MFSCFKTKSEKKITTRGLFISAMSLVKLITEILVYICHKNMKSMGFFYGFSKVFAENFIKNILREMKNGLSLRQQQLQMIIYYIHTEKYSPKSCFANFDTQMSSSQSEEWTMVFTREKNDTSNQNRERCFFTCEKNDTSNQKPQSYVSFAPKFPPFLAACCAPLRTHSRRKVFLRVFFSLKKWKTYPHILTVSYVFKKRFY